MIPITLDDLVVPFVEERRIEPHIRVDSSSFLSFMIPITIDDLVVPFVEERRIELPSLPLSFLVSDAPALQSVSAPLPDSSPQEQPALDIRRECRDIISAFYVSFEQEFLSQPSAHLYDAFKASRVSALKNYLQEKAHSAETFAERQLYLNYARVAHLQFAQKEKASALHDRILSQYQEVPEPFACSAVPSSSSDYLPLLAGAGIGFAMARGNARQRKKLAKKKGDTPLPPVDDSDGSIEMSAAEDWDGGDTHPGVGDHSQGFAIPYAASSGSFIAEVDHSGALREVDASHGKDHGGLHQMDATARQTMRERFREDYAPDVEIALGSAFHSRVLSSNPITIPALQKPVASKPRGIFKTIIYSALAITTAAAAGILLYTGLVSSPDSPTLPKEHVASSYTASQTGPQSPLENSLSPALLASSSAVTYNPAVAPAYTAQNPAPWYQIEKADLRNNGKTLDLRLGPHLSQTERIIRVTYDSTGDGRADRVKYVDAQEQVTITVPGIIIDVGVGFKHETGFEYHSSVRFDSKNAV